MRRIFSKQSHLRWACLVTVVFHLGLTVALAVSWSERIRSRFAGADTIELSLAVPQLVEHAPPTRIEYEPELATSEVVISPLRATVARSTYVLAAHGVAPPKLQSLEPIRPQVTRVERQPVERQSVRSAKHLPRRKRSRPLQISTKATLPKSVGNDRKTPPDFSNNPPPRYPAIAIQRGWQGRVMLRVQIAASGRVQKVTVIKSSGHPVLDAAAVNAVKRWTAQPAQRGGRAVPTTEILPVRFRR